ncbi:hypothetical protein F4802DRAFT_574706 [Xylaria palmicola]|nr:hypothetical protein F4802DRAFT_574706 [Xylaria palmicola]
MQPVMEASYMSKYPSSSPSPPPSCEGDEWPEMPTEDTVLPTGPFRFCSLPTEIRFYILSSTDLVTPTGKVRWDPVNGYHLGPWPGSAGDASWRLPDALFLVSRAFAAQAREVFFGHNKILLWPSASRVSELPSTTTDGDYAATAYLGLLGVGSLRSLRRLDLFFYPCDGTDRHEQARGHWCRALRRAHGDGRLDDLRAVVVTGSWPDAPALLEGPEATPEAFASLRTFVRDHVWPMVDPEHGPPQLPCHLAVMIQSRYTWPSKYSIRKRGQHCLDEEDTARVGPLTASRYVSWRPQDRDDAAGRWVEDISGGEWIEEINVDNHSRHPYPFAAARFRTKTEMEELLRARS